MTINSKNREIEEEVIVNSVLLGEEHPDKECQHVAGDNEETRDRYTNFGIICTEIMTEPKGTDRLTPQKILKYREREKGQVKPNLHPHLGDE